MGSLLYSFEYGGTRHGSLSRGGGLGSGPTTVVFCPASVLVLVWDPKCLGFSVVPQVF